jgi:hypothetical protein
MGLLQFDEIKQFPQAWQPLERRVPGDGGELVSGVLAE